ncbi:TRAP transporter substrate-binding protein DctP [Castellaniella denitrificans]|jgi:TRAP-type C4-dicarboxylate transport system substrate-binding protein|uniref:TRAP transporter substrate-binding protein n=1 Tax=Castellaniella denitrificans TaxID=56119 RepID=UPI0036193E92
MKKIDLKCLAVVAAVALTTPAAWGENMMVGNGFSPTHFFGKDLTEPWMACVKEGTRGEISFQYFPSGQIAATGATLDALNTGLLQVAAVSVGYVTNKLPLNGVSMLPGMGQTSRQMVTTSRRALAEIPALAAEMKANRIHPLVINLFAPYQVMSVGKPIETADQFKGRLIRSAGAANTLTIKGLGASPVEMPAADIYVALERGTVDAALLGVPSIKSYSLQELLKSISANGQFGSFSTLLAMDLDVYQKLPDAQRAVVDDCSAKVEDSVARLMDDEQKSLLHEFGEKGIAIYTYSDAELAKLDERMKGVGKDFVDRLGARGLPAEAVFTGYQKILSETPAVAE